MEVGVVQYHQRWQGRFLLAMQNMRHGVGLHSPVAITTADFIDVDQGTIEKVDLTNVRKLQENYETTTSRY